MPGDTIYQKCTCPDCGVEECPTAYGDAIPICGRCGADLADVLGLGPTEKNMRDLMNRIYIARNITLDEKALLECLDTIDKWFRTRNTN